METTSHYSKIRETFAHRLGDGLIVLSGGIPVPRNHDVDHVFRQKSDFLYLTGVEEPGCFLILDPHKNREALFMPKVDSHYRVWLGDVPGPKEARTLFGVKQVFYSDELPKIAKLWSKGHKKLYADSRSLENLKKSVKLKNRAEDLRDAFDELRAIKTAGEIALLKKAGDVSSKAHIAAMRFARAGQYEYEIQAVFEAECLKAGFRHLGYPSIVAAGTNAAVLHYGKNDALIKENDLLLIDAAAENAGYSADITRTFPISGHFTPRQRDIYSIVLETQKKAIQESRPGIISAELHVNSMKRIAEGLKSLGILNGDTIGLVENGAVRLFYPHGLTHMLGLDVHDVLGGKKRQLPNPTKVPVRFIAKLEPGFVITMEPGIYFIKVLLEDKALRRKYKTSVDFDKAAQFYSVGGVRIEDDIVIQEKGPPLNLTSAPKEIADVEAACAR